MNVLLADDDDISRRVVKFHLEKWGHSVVSAVDGEQAWELLQQNDCQVVITDWMMPRMTGIELLRKIRESDRSGYIYVIVLTSNSEKKALITGLANGADDFLTKPVDPGELQARLQSGKRIFDLESSLAERNRDLEFQNYQLAETNARTKRDLEAAAQIQQSYLPSRVQSLPDIRFAWHYSPCNELAEDMLSIFRLDEDHVGVYVLDVSGHGVQASLLAVTACRYLSNVKDESSVLWQCRNDSSEYCLRSPADAVEKLNSRFVSQAMSEQYFTLVYGILNQRTGEFRYSVAGHPSPVCVPSTGHPSFLPGDGLPVGICETTYDEHSTRLDPGDRLFFYTDGLTECMNPAEKLFGNERLITGLKGTSDVDIDSAQSQILNHVNQWIGGGPIHDDLSLITIEYAPQSNVEPLSKGHSAKRSHSSGLTHLGG